MKTNITIGFHLFNSFLGNAPMGNFVDRLSAVLAGRKLYPWIQGLGLAASSAGYIGRGCIPGPAILNVMLLRENINISWLVSGVGAPYLVNRCATDEELATALKTQPSSPTPLQTALFTDRRTVIVELTSQDEYTYKDKTITYEKREYVAGPLRKRTQTFLEEALAGQTVCLSQIEPSLLLDASKGLINPRTLASSTHLAPETGDVTTLITKYIQTDHAREPVSVSLLRSVLRMVRQLASDERQQLSIEAESRIVAAAYQHAIRKELAPDDLDPEVVRVMLDAL